MASEPQKNLETKLRANTFNILVSSVKKAVRKNDSREVGTLLRSLIDYFMSHSTQNASSWNISGLLETLEKIIEDKPRVATAVKARTLRAYITKAIIPKERVAEGQSSPSCSNGLVLSKSIASVEITKKEGIPQCSPSVMKILDRPKRILLPRENPTIKALKEMEQTSNGYLDPTVRRKPKRASIFMPKRSSPY